MESNEPFLGSSLYIVGRYNKFSRNLCQTPWILDGGVRRMESSVQELIVDEIEKRVQFEKARFSSCGREDVDVRMLGDGRPFVVELIKPQANSIDDQTLDEIERSINLNSVIKVRDIQLEKKEVVKVQLRTGETDKKKVYRALCCIDRPFTDADIEKLDAIEDLTIEQKTPIRVLHRRTLLNRTRIVHHIKSEKTEHPKKFIINLKTEAGTYIKEFVHGDLGRTSPSLAQVLGDDCRTDILELDVMEVTMDWPKPKSNRIEIQSQNLTREPSPTDDHEVCSKKMKMNESIKEEDEQLTE